MSLQHHEAAVIHKQVSFSQYNDPMSFSIATLTDLLSIQISWQDLVKQSATHKIFLHPIYQQTWWEALGQGKLKVITVRDHRQQLVGLAPLFVHEHRLGFVGCKDVTDYLDFIVHSEYQAEVYTLLARALVDLIDEEQIIEAEFCSIPASSPTLQQLPELLLSLRPNLKVNIQQQDVCPQIDLPANFDQYLTSLDRKQRHEVKRKIRKLRLEAEYRMEIVTDIDPSFNPIKVFIHLHQLSSPDKYNFWHDQHRQFFEKLLPRFAQEGWLKLFFLHIDRWLENSLGLPLPTQPIAAMLIFDYDHVYNLYNSGYDPQYRQLSTGQVLTSLTIQHAIENQKTVYDFLRGNEEYKLRLGGKPEAVFDLKIHN